MIQQGWARLNERIEAQQRPYKSRMVSNLDSLKEQYSEVRVFLCSWNLLVPKSLYSGMLQFDDEEKFKAAEFACEKWARTSFCI